MWWRARDVGATARRVPRALYATYACKLLESVAYFATSLNLVLALGEPRYGALGDAAAGDVYGGWGAALGAWSLALGVTAVDRMGVRAALLTGGALLLLGRALLAGATNRAQLYTSLFFLQSAGCALSMPVLAIAVRRLSTPAYTALAYGVFYAIMNLGALVAGLLTDALRGNAAVASSGVLWWLLAGLALPYLACAWFVNGPELAPPAPPPPPPRSLRELEQCDPLAEELELGYVAPLPTSVWRDPVMWSMAAIGVAVCGSLSVFRAADATMPVWMLRTMGPGARFALVYAVNPVIVIVGAPLMQYAMARYRVDPYDALVTGTALVACAPFCLVYWRAGYGTALGFQLLLSLGEIIYSPKLAELSMRLSVRGREGVYGAWATVPRFLVQLVIGPLSGALLQRFCPAAAAAAAAAGGCAEADAVGAPCPFEHRCRWVWFFIGLVAFASPLLLLIGRACLYTPAVRARLAASAPK